MPGHPDPKKLRQWATGNAATRVKWSAREDIGTDKLLFKINGAYIGDLFMSLIHTCNLCKVNPFEYLKTLHQHFSELFRDPDK